MKKCAYLLSRGLIAVLMVLMIFLQSPCAGMAEAADNELPDLTVEDGVFFDPPGAGLGKPVTFSVMVHNNSKIDLPEDSRFTCSFALDGNEKTRWYSEPFTGPMHADQYVMIKMNGTWKITGGKHVVAVKIDCQNQIMENNENNNTVSMSFNVPVPRPAELVIPSCTISPRTAIVGKQATLGIKIYNDGDVAIPKNTPIHVDIKIQGNKKVTMLSAIYKDGLREGQTVTLKVNWKPVTKGLYLYTATIKENKSAYKVNQKENNKKCYFDVE